MEESEPKVQAFGGMAGRVLRGTLSAGPLLSGFVLITSLGFLGYVLREGGARDAFLIVSQLSVVLVLSRFARNGLAGEWEGTIFSSHGGSWLDAGAVSFRYLVLTMVWLLPVLLMGWRPEAVMEVVGQVIMGGGASKLLALTAIFFTHTAPTPPVFLIVSVGASRFADFVDQRHWGRLFANRGGDLFLVYRDNQDLLVFARQVLHQLHGRPVGYLFDSFVPTRLLLRAEIRRGKDFLHAQNLDALLGRRFDQAEVFLDVDFLDLFDRRVRRRGVLRLNQTTFDDT